MTSRMRSLSLTNVSERIESQLWNGKVAVCIGLNPLVIDGSCKSSTGAEPLYTFVSRCSYLTFLHNEVREHFKAMFTDGVASAIDLGEIWFEFKGYALRWNIPAGVLFDLCAQGQGLPLPWRIKVHFQNYPTDKLIRLGNGDSEAVVEAHYMAMLKEADYLENGSTKLMMGLLKSDQQQLWDAFCTGEWSRYNEVNNRLSRPNSQYSRYIPLRLYLLTSGSSGLDDVVILQDTWSPLALNDTVEACTDDIHDGNGTRTAENEACDSSCETSSKHRDNTLGDVMNDVSKVLDIDVTLLRPILHGVVPSLDASLQWLSDYCAYPDRFLHVCIFTDELL